MAAPPTPPRPCPPLRQIEDDPLAITSPSSRVSVRSYEAPSSSSQLYQIAPGAPLYSARSPMHRLYSKESNLSLSPTKGCPADNPKLIKCPCCPEYFAPAEMKEHVKCCASSSSVDAALDISGAPRCEMCNEVLAMEISTFDISHSRASSSDFYPPPLQLAYYLNDCGHVFSKLCLSRHIRNTVKRYKTTTDMVKCPARDCGRVIAAVDLLNFLTVEEHDQLQANEIERFVEESDGVYSFCPKCSMLFERVPTEPLANGSTEVNGQALSQDHLTHYATYRLRCPLCQHEFCASCKESPYHLGSTCSQFAELAKAKICRFCDAPVEAGSGSPRRLKIQTCGSEECLEKSEQACTRTLECGHPCPGIANETACPPCFVQGCSSNPGNIVGSQWCSICYAEDLRAAPCIVLSCNHAFHYKCIMKQLLQKWPGPRISFGFMNCPECGQEISHVALKDALEDLNKFRAEVRNLALLRLKHEGMDQDDAVVTADGQFYNDPAGYAEAVLSYYQCYVCERPYFGGARRCDAINNEEARYNPTELVCAACVPFRDLKFCDIHGADFIEYKCKFCCSVAQWFCWGTTHFCIACHRMQERGDFVTKKKPSDLPQCQGRKNCPLKVDHPQNGTEEFALGCAVCRFSALSSQY